MHQDFDFGQPSHLNKVWHMCVDSKIFQRKGERVKVGRWASYLNAHRSWRGEKSCLLLILTYMGVVRGWWKSGDDLPIASSRLRCMLDEDGEEGAEQQATAGPSDALVHVGVASSSSAAPPRASASSSSSHCAPAPAAPATSSAGSVAEAPAVSISTLGVSLGATSRAPFASRTRP